MSGTGDIFWLWTIRYFVQIKFTPERINGP